MSFKWDRVHVWSGEIPDQPGSVANKLAFLAQAGANLEYVESQRVPSKPALAVLYPPPATHPPHPRAARRGAGLRQRAFPIPPRLEGDTEAGLAHRLTQQWALAGISLHGLTMAVLGGKFVGYAVFDSVADANRAAQILADLGTASGEFR